MNLNLTPLILFFFFLTACGSQEEKDGSKPEKTIIAGADSVKVRDARFDLNGTWGLTNYFDTIVANRALAEYRLQPPTWFAILLEIQNDSLQNYGSIENGQYAIHTDSDTLLTITSELTGNDWDLVQSEPYLTLVQRSATRGEDTAIYVFRKREDLEYFTKRNRKDSFIGKNVTDFFNRQLFEGEYLNQDTQEEVVFGSNGQLSGIDGFDTYEVGNYFGTLHMHKNLDVVTFKNKDNPEFKQYNWVFAGNELLLTEFVYETVTSNGETYEGDYLVPGKEKINLVKP